MILSLGTNLGDRNKNLSRVLILLQNRVGDLLKQSSLFETQAWGSHDLLPFLNQVVSFSTALSPKAVLRESQHIEKLMGRSNQSKGGKNYQNRLIDIDILFYDDAVIKEEELKIPHALLHKRNFVLVPLVEIEPNCFHPVLQKTVKELLEQSSDFTEVKKYQKL